MSNWGRIGVFDLETTGVDVDTSRIVSACIAILDESGDVLSRWDWLADPGIEIPEGAARVHGITTERARAEGRPSAMVVAEIAQTLRLLFGLGMPVVVYNAPYDLSLLDRECRRNDLLPVDRPFPIIDPLVLDKAVDRFRKGKRTLEVTAELYGVDLDDAHDAGSDAIAAGRVALALARAYPKELAISADDLHGRQEVWYREQAESFQQYIRTTKGDVDYVANAEWPLRAAANPQAFVDTQPIPAPEPRPSLTVPVLDLYGTGVLSLESLASAPSSAYATAPPPTLIPRQPVSSPAVTIAPARRPTVLRVAAGIVTDGDGRTLVVRKRGTSMFMQAGGKIEPGESALDALTRELLEEIGLVLDPDTTEYLGSFRAEAANEPDTVIRAEVFAVVARGPLVAAGEIEELRWLDSLDTGVDLAPLTRDTVLPLWVERRSALF
jgi:DNA polymerase III epsilon subunit-like protein/8-oxo-dGTP pyrophosphatase MutT (NUDIX family)